MNISDPAIKAPLRAERGAAVIDFVPPLRCAATMDAKAKADIALAWRGLVRAFCARCPPIGQADPLAVERVLPNLLYRYLVEHAGYSPLFGLSNFYQYHLGTTLAVSRFFDEWGSGLRVALGVDGQRDLLRFMSREVAAATSLIAEALALRSAIGTPVSDRAGVFEDVCARARALARDWQEPVDAWSAGVIVARAAEDHGVPRSAFDFEEAVAQLVTMAGPKR